MVTLDRTINADADDGGSNESGDWNDDFDTTLLGDPFGEGEHTWLRFPNITIPQGATIDVAYITFQADDSGLFDSGTIRSNIFGIDEDDHAAPTSDGTWATDHSTHTSASAVWDFTAQDSGSLQTPSIVSIIQEIVDRAGWTSGNDIGIHVDDDGTSGAGQELAANEHSSLSAASLHVEYTEGGTTHQETAAGSVSLTGTAAGKAIRKAIAAGSVSVTGTATAKAIRKATASGTVSISGVVDAKSQPQKATAAGAISVTGTATAKKVAKATASGTVSVAGTADGKRPPRQATAAGSISITGTAAARAVRKVTASGQVSVLTSGLAWRPREHTEGGYASLVSSGQTAVTVADSTTKATSEAEGLVSTTAPGGQADTENPGGLAELED